MYYKNNTPNREDESLQNQKKETVGLVAKGEIREKTGLKKFLDVFLPKSRATSKDKILVEVIIPKVKDSILEMVQIIIYGDNYGSYSSKNTNASRISYKSYYGNDSKNLRSSDRNRRYSNNVNSIFSYEDVVLDSREQAEEVLDRMDEIISRWGEVRVPDYCEMVGVTVDYTLNDYGWTNISSAKTLKLRHENKWIIKLPSAKLL